MAISTGDGAVGPVGAVAVGAGATLPEPVSGLLLEKAKLAASTKPIKLTPATPTNKPIIKVSRGDAPIKILGLLAPGAGEVETDSVSSPRGVNGLSIINKK